MLRLPREAAIALLASIGGGCSLSTSGIGSEAASASVGSTGGSSSMASSGEGGSSSSSGTAAGGAGGGAGMGNGGSAGSRIGCGDGAVVAPEECDDANDASGDGCSSSCIVECAGTKVLKDPTTHHCYMLMDTDLLGWSAAEDACLAIGTHLVAIGSQLERDAIVPLLDQSQSDVWIGASDAAVEGTFAWTSGEPWTYEDWAPGDPNGDTLENCVRLDKASSWEFRTIGCDDPVRPYVCERTPAGR